MLIIGILFITIMIFITGFFAGMETGLLSVSRTKLQNLASKGDKKASLTLNILETPPRFIGTSLVGINLSHVIISVLSSWYFNKYFNNPSISALLTALIVTPLLLFFGEILPKAIFRLRPHQATLASINIFHVVSKLFYPLTKTIMIISETLIPLSDKNKEDSSIRRNEILALVREGERSGTIEDDEKEMIESVLELSGITLKEVMTPKSAMSYISTDMSHNEIMKKIADEGYTRYPVIEGPLDNVIGILHVARLLDDDLIDFSSIPKPIFLSEFTKVDDALELLRSKSTHTAIVVDEYGSLAGFVTIEDLLEELVGEIEDEHDDPVKKVNRISENIWIADAQADISSLEEEIGSFIDRDKFEAETVGGIILEKAGKIPKPGEKITIGSLIFKIISSDERRIIKVEIVQSK